MPVLGQAAESYKEDNPDFVLYVEEMANDDIRSKVTTGLQSGGQGLPEVALLVGDGIIDAILIRSNMYFALIALQPSFPFAIFLMR